MINRYRILGSILLLSAATMPTFSQNAPTASPARATWQLGLGSAGMGTGDYMCFKAHVEYTPLFGRYLGTGTRLAFVNGSRESYNWLKHPTATSFGIRVPFVMGYQAFNAEQEVYVYPFGNDKQVLFAVGGGGYLGYSNRYGAPEMRGDFTNNTSEVVLDHEQGVHAGYMFSLNLDVALTSDQRWLVGGKAAFQNDTFGNSLASLQVKLGHRF
ncbi:hypothetical protein [Hymenobacter crusticola]|uniref:Outer membrane protein beta-barrel domain-containing protein n=1 Tax=Hymenobacter crusticola TaxID=1770526 RepID=A0A243WBG1_9BACT|nr:hypothetical protein [Hymenobacter crusticola]OUJ72849.1 hypothetical protein BXP70_16180 [Hymenobacter crusticola]